MLSFLAVLMNPFFIQDGMIVDDPYYQQMSIEDESDTNDDNSVLLAYDGSETPAGQVMTISHDSSESSNAVENCNQQIDADEDIEKTPDEEDELEIQEASAQKSSQDMAKEFGEMRMIQLANSIAGDMGMVTQVTLVG